VELRAQLSPGITMTTRARLQMGAQLKVRATSLNACPRRRLPPMTKIHLTARLVGKPYSRKLLIGAVVVIIRYFQLLKLMGLDLASVTIEQSATSITVRFFDSAWGGRTKCASSEASLGRRNHPSSFNTKGDYASCSS
jgi:hypothetical protein